MNEHNCLVTSTHLTICLTTPTVVKMDLGIGGDARGRLSVLQARAINNIDIIILDRCYIIYLTLLTGMPIDLSDRYKFVLYTFLFYFLSFLLFSFFRFSIDQQRKQNKVFLRFNMPSLFLFFLCFFFVFFFN